MHIGIITPVYNDWRSFSRLVADLDLLAADTDHEVTVLAVDDGSPDAPPMALPDTPRHLRGVEVARLMRNLGHQRAIAVGLAEADTRGGFDAVIVMDADGEDRPQDIVRLLEAHHAQPDHLIVAMRGKRSESIGFRAGYLVYKGLFRLLSGRHIDFGNFCLIPAARLLALSHNPVIWNHFAATLVKSRLPVTRVRVDRGTRYDGQSKMNLESLLLHGLSAIAVYADVVFLRLLVFSGIVALLASVGIGVVVGVLLFTELAIPGWATSAAGILAIIVLQMLLVSASAVFFLLNLRAHDFTSPAHESLTLIHMREHLHHGYDSDIRSELQLHRERA